MNQANLIVVMTDQSGVIQEIHGKDNIVSLKCGASVTENWLPLNGDQEEGWTYIGESSYRYQRFCLSRRPGYLYVLHRERSANEAPGSGSNYKRSKPPDAAVMEKIIGSSSIMSALRETLLWIAASPSSVLITGESGTGKELLAQAIHSCGERAKGRFVKVNCAAIPENLLESELFGYVDGAFTGARKGGRTGKFELANRGTIFLDEIGDMPLAMQAKLLRVLQEKEIERIGDDRITPLDFRILSATNKDLSVLISKGFFRLDLYYRLNVLNLHIPALRERREDIPLLTAHFIEKFNHKLGLQVHGIDNNAMMMLLNYDWPGNVRELSNVIETAMNFTRLSVMGPESLPSYLRQNHPAPSDIGELSLKNGLMTTEYEQIRAALNASSGSRQQAALLLGVSRTTLYRLMKKHKLI